MSVRFIRPVLAVLIVGLCFSGCNTEQKKPLSARESSPRSAVPGSQPEQTSSSLGRQATARLTLGEAQNQAQKTKLGALERDEPSSQPRVLFFGKVTREGGVPAAGATVELLQLRGVADLVSDVARETVTSTLAGEDGSYELATTGPRLLLLRAGAPQTARILVEASESGCVEQFGARPSRVRRDIFLPSCASIRGKVVDESGQPPTSVTLRAFACGGIAPPLQPGVAEAVAESLETSCTKDGHFQLERAAAGFYLLVVESPGHVPMSMKVKAPCDDLLVRLSSKGAVLEGMVCMLDTREGVASATVRLRLNSTDCQLPLPGFAPLTTQTDSLGFFRFDRLPAGSYDIQAAKEPLGLLEALRPAVHLGEMETSSGVELFLYPGHTLYGTLREHGSGKAIAGAAVISGYGNSMRRSETDQEGRYRLEGVFGGAATLRLRKKGYQLFSANGFLEPFPLPATRLQVERNLEMVPAVSVSGAVRMEDGRPLSGATMEFVLAARGGAPCLSGAMSSSKGLYELEAPPFSTLRVVARISGAPVAFSQPLEVNDKPVSASEIVVKPGGKLSGTVVDPSGGAVEGAVVKAVLTLPMGAETSIAYEVASATSDAKGAFALTPVPEGKLSLVALKKGYAQSPSQELGLSSRETKRGIRLALQTSHSISGKVVDSRGNGVGDVSLDADSISGAEDGSATARSANDGTYRLEDLPSGVYRLSASCSLGSQNKDNVRTDSEHVDFVLGRGDEETSPKLSGMLAGSVLDWKSREPVQDFSVEVQGLEGAEVQKDDTHPGRFTVRDLRLDYGFRLRISSPGYLDLKSKYLSVRSESKPLEREFVLGPGGTIRGRVVKRREKKPLAGVRVELREASEREWESRPGPPAQSCTTGADGTFVFEKVSAGTNSVEFCPEASSLAALERTVEVSHGNVCDLGEVQIGSGGVVTGKLLSKPGGAPVAGALIEVNDNRGNATRSTSTLADGCFRIEGLRPSQYRLRVPEHSLSSWFELNGEETREITLYLGTGVLNGLVLKRGRPALQVAVHLQQEDNSGRRSTQTDSEGRFHLEGLAPGKAHLTLMPAPLYDSTGHGFGGSPIEETIDILGGENSRTYQLPSGCIVGRVVDDSGHPVGNAAVTIFASQATGSYWPAEQPCAPDGGFRFDDLRAGEYQLSVRHAELGYASAKVHVPDDGDSPQVELRLEKVSGGTLVSTALNMEGQPLEQAWCWLTGANGRFFHGCVRDATGVMTIPDIPPGRYQVEVSAWCYSISEHTVDIQAGQTLRIYDVLYSGGGLRWTLLDKEGKPLAGAFCTLTPSSPDSIERPREGVSDSSGTWVVRGLMEGDYDVQANVAGGSRLTSHVHIANGQITFQVSRSR